MDVYEDALNATSSKDAPWYVIPANKKWYRNMLVSRILIDALEQLKMKYPPAVDGLAEVKIV
jgi:polyphosphate kinase 2 (PPK2 family)